VIQKAAKEAFAYVCDGRPYRFEGDVFHAVQAAVSRCTLVDAVQVLIEALLDDWNHGFARPMGQDACPPPEWWDKVTADERLAVSERVYRRDNGLEAKS
jgi:hypothetical protein